MLMGYSRFFADWWERDLVDWIRRDRNHPCVIAWSVGNEVEEQKTPHAGRELGARLAAVAHREDPFRPVTMGCDSTAVFTNGMMEAMDIYGANYRPDFYKELLERFPGKGVLGTETASMVSSRDTYFYPLPDGFEKRPRPFRKGYLDRQVSYITVPSTCAASRKTAIMHIRPNGDRNMRWYTCSPTGHGMDVKGRGRRYGSTRLATRRNFS